MQELQQVAAKELITILLQIQAGVNLDSSMKYGLPITGSFRVQVLVFFTKHGVRFWGYSWKSDGTPSPQSLMRVQFNATSYLGGNTQLPYYTNKDNSNVGGSDSYAYIDQFGGPGTPNIDGSGTAIFTSTGWDYNLKTKTLSCSY